MTWWPWQRPKKPKSRFLNIKNGSNITVDNNVVIGADEFIRAKGVTGLKARGNIHTGPNKNSARWYQSVGGQLVIGIVTAVAAGGILYVLGWSH